jgi:hypothetical protein
MSKKGGPGRTLAVSDLASMASVGATTRDSLLQLQAASRGEGRPNACVEVGVRVAESGATFFRVQASRLMHGWRSVSPFSTPSVARDVHSSSPRSPAIYPVHLRSREKKLESRPPRYKRDTARISYPARTTTQRLIESNIVAIPWQSKGRKFRGQPPLSLICFLNFSTFSWPGSTARPFYCNPESSVMCNLYFAQLAARERPSDPSHSPLLYLPTHTTEPPVYHLPTSTKRNTQYAIPDLDRTEELP